jgi:hypothetical protein
VAEVKVTATAIGAVDAVVAAVEAAVEDYFIPFWNVM